MIMQCHTRGKSTHRFACKTLRLCLCLLFLCRVRAEKESSRKRRGRRPRRKCLAAATGITWCLALSPAVPPAHCAARPCRKSMACSAWVSNTYTTTGVYAHTLALRPARAENVHRCSAHTQKHIYLCTRCCTHARSPTCRSKRCVSPSPHTHSHTHLTRNHKAFIKQSGNTHMLGATSDYFWLDVILTHVLTCGLLWHLLFTSISYQKKSHIIQTVAFLFCISAERKMLLHISSSLNNI